MLVASPAEAPVAAPSAEAAGGCGVGRLASAVAAYRNEKPCGLLPGSYRLVCWFGVVCGRGPLSPDRES